MTAAAKVYRRAVKCANDLGLFSEEYDPKGRGMLGNFPQGLTHLSHVFAALTLMNIKPPHG
jgi:GH15 family glucan-1,4-alpha-glucosidase